MGSMIPIVIAVLGAVLVVLGVLVLLSVVHIAVAWWVLLLVGLGLVFVGWYLRRGAAPPLV
jgi:hypothetical protein